MECGPTLFESHKRVEISRKKNIRNVTPVLERIFSKKNSQKTINAFRDNNGGVLRLVGGHPRVRLYFTPYCGRVKQ